MQTTRQLVPEFIYDKFRNNEISGVFQGAAMFVDLSGFSTMTDALSAHGTHGAEVLANMMRVVFEPLVNAVYEQGGFVIGYAGDAFNAVFPTEQDAGQTMRRCLAAAVQMQAHAKANQLASTPYGDFSIRIKVGIGYGQVTWQIFKSINGKRASYWFRGESLTGAVLGEERAYAGEIVADPISYKLISDIVEVRPVQECFLIEKVIADLPAALPVPTPEPADDLASIFLADTIAHLPISGEFRQAMNLFIDIPVNISDQALITPFMETVYLLQEQYGGVFLRPDLGDKGFNLLMFWGAPIAYENDVDRALNFIIELATRTRITLRAGITYHMAYAGFIGSSKREDYTAYGWGINLAARMMEHAGQGEYWMSEEVARRAEKHFNLNFLGEHHFKGFKQDQKVFSLLGRKNIVETVYQGQLVGREKEMENLRSFTEPIHRGNFAGVMVLQGEAGMGKSRLIHSFQFSEYFTEHPARWVVCQADEILRLPFNPFKDWLKKRFELLEGQPDEINAIAFNRNLQELANITPDPELAAELIRTRSVLSALINITQPDSLYESLDAKGRYDNTLIALSALLRAESLQRPLVLFLEDTHWMDEDTGNFLSYFMRTLLAESEKQYPIAIITTQRPEGNANWELDGTYAHHIKLEKLPAASIAHLAKNIVDHPISASLLELLISRTDGNPFFAEQVLRYLTEHNALSLNEEGEYIANQAENISLPTDVRAVLVARLDRLTKQVKEAVQTASVLGREFEIRVLGLMLKNDKRLLSHVAQAESANIWTPLSEIEFIFRHALLRDAAYSMHLVARQRELHGLAVSAMETIYHEDLEPHYGELAYHAEKAALNEKALHYLNLAADSASQAYQNAQVIDYLTRAHNLLPQNSQHERFEVLYKRSIAYSIIGNRSSEDMDLTALEETASALRDNTKLARVLMRRTYYFATQGENFMAISFGERAATLAQSVNDMETLGEVYNFLPSAFTRVGSLKEAFDCAQKALKLSQSTNNRLGEGNALTSLGLIALENKGPSEAYQYQANALKIARELGNRDLEAKVLNNLANLIGLSNGDYSTARDYFEQAQVIYQEQGRMYPSGLALTNLGWVSNMLGDYETALTYHTRALTIAREVGNKTQEMYTLINLSASTFGKGNNPNAAIYWAEKALWLSEKIADQIGTAWSFFYLGYGYMLGKQYPAARQAFESSLKIREGLDAKVLTAESQAAIGQTLYELMDIEAAFIEVEKVLEYMQENPNLEGAEEPLRVMLTCYLVLKEKRDPRHKNILQNANLLLDTQVSKLRSDEARHVYVENVPWRRMLRKYYKETQ
ncbi:MAG TPA: tetratricopeptide repeat protein [Anaerolineales bacterium]|nr:tetratricopeptide repeat protein [Anaerolineales bacterium]